MERVIDKHPGAKKADKHLTDREFYLTMVNTYIGATFFIDDKLEECEILKGMLLKSTDNMEAYQIKRNLARAAADASEKTGMAEILNSVILTFGRTGENKVVYRLAGDTSKL